MARDYLSREQGFLGIDADQAAPADAPAVEIIPFGLEATVSYEGGTQRGPAAMIAASHQVELFDEELWCEPCRSFRVQTLAEPNLPAQTEAALDLLETLTGAALARGAFPFTFGGEHSITPGALRPFVNRWSDLVLLHFDAHADLRDSYAGEKYSHASALRRCMDAPTLEVISIGIRNISAEEVPFLEANRDRLHIHWAKDKARWQVERMLAPLRGRPFYLTFDVDGFDGSVMPATGTPEPGGLFWTDVLPIIRRACLLGTLVGADINELAPVPGLHACDFLAAKLAYKILAYRFCR